MSLIPVIDRVPTLPGRWLVTHEDNTTEYVTVTRADEPTTIGSAINRALFNNLQGDVYTGVQYNTPTYSGNDMALDLPLTSYEVGKIVNIKCPTMSSGTYEKTRYTDIIPKSGWSGSNLSYTSGSVTLTASSRYTSSSTDTPANASDGNDSTVWNSGGTSNTQWLQLDFGSAVKIAKMKIHISTSSQRPFTSKIQGSNDGASWTDLKTGITTPTLSEEITLSSTNYFRYYRLYGTSSYAESTYLGVYEWQVSQWIEKFPVTETTNPTLNINGLGAKTINGTLRYGENYTLIYNGTSFDVLQKDYVTGAYVGDNATSRFINLGFTPKAVFVWNRTSYVESSTDVYGGLALPDYPVTDRTASQLPRVEIVNYGFNVGGNTNSTATNVNPYRYIAWK